MSFDATRWAWGFRLPTLQKVTLLALADHANDAGCCWPSVARICEMTGAKDRAVRAALASLKAGGLIQADNQPGRSTRFHLRLDVTAATPAADAGVARPALAVPAPRQQMPGYAVAEPTEKPTEPRHHMHPTPAPDAGPPRQQMPTNLSLEPAKEAKLAKPAFAKATKRRADKVEPKRTAEGWRRLYAEWIEGGEVGDPPLPLMAYLRGGRPYVELGSRQKRAAVEAPSVAASWQDSPRSRAQARDFAAWQAQGGIGKAGPVPQLSDYAMDGSRLLARAA